MKKLVKESSKDPVDFEDSSGSDLDLMLNVFMFQFCEFHNCTLTILKLLVTIKSKQWVETSQNVQLQIDNSNWASEASPTLGCSIEISRDICICIYSILHRREKRATLYGVQ